MKGFPCRNRFFVHTALYLSILTAIVLAFPIFASGCGPNTGKPGGPVATYKAGNLYKAGKIDVLVLEGGYREMGEQYGRLAGKRIESMYDAIVDAFEGKTFEGKGVVDLMKSTCPGYLELYPERFREIVRGISETSGMTETELSVVDQFQAFLELNVGTQWPESCSSMIAWDFYTGDGPLVVGRNFDSGRQFMDFARYLTVVVYKPDGGVPSATLCYAGQVGTIQGFNAEGLVVETNSGARIPHDNLYYNRQPFTLNQLQMMLDYSSLEQMESSIQTFQVGVPEFIGIADTFSGYIFEVSTDRGIARDTGYGLLVNANTPTSPSWGLPPPVSIRWDDIRHQNLEQLGEEYRGQIDAAVMRKIFDKTVDEGGATIRKGPYVTIYQFVYVPEKLQLWLSVPDFQGWTRVDLDPLFEDGSRD